MKAKLLRFSIFIVGMLFSLNAIFAQDISVSGKVSGANGDPLSGATVLLKGTSQGAFTDASGTFKINVPNDRSVLVFSFVGYLSQEIPVGNQRNINVALVEGVNQLEDIVITGYGTQRKAEVTGAISQVKGADLGNLPVFSTAGALQGRAAGVNVIRNGGAPGATQNIRIRGVGTINDANPLVVIDGVPGGSLSDINPNDIESVEILKDASSSAIYGLRAANGVVLVTTKRGRANEKLSISVNAYTGVSSVVNTIEVLDAPTLAELKRERYTNDGIPVNPIWQDAKYQTQLTDWQEELFETGITNNLDLSVRGGSERASFFVSGGLYDEQGIIKKAYQTRVYARINSDFQVNDWLKVGENLQITRQVGNSLGTSSAQTGLIWSAIRFHPGLPVQDANGVYGTSQVSGEFGDINNPIYTVDVESDEATNNRILGNFFAEIKLLEGLKLKGNFALEADIFDRDEFQVIVDKQIRANSRNTLNRSYNEFYSLLAEYFLTYNKIFADVHSVNLVGGYTAQTFNSEGFSAQRRDFAQEDPELRVLDFGNTITGAGGSKSEDGLNSLFARVNYGFDDKYLLTATFRADGSSKFAEDNKWGYFPAFSAGWRISREEFFKVPFVSSLKLTGGWGRLGNQGIPSLQYLALIRRDVRYSFGGESTVGSRQFRIPNEEIGWETSQMTDIGLEAGFFDNSLLVNLNYFIKDTEDMLLAPQVVGTQGRATVPNQNIGELRNSGLEIEARYLNAVGDFTYNISGNISFITNEVITLNTPFLSSTRYGRPNQEIARTFVGSPIGTFYGWRTNGLYQTQSDVDGDPNISNDPRKANGQIKPGDVRFVDLNGDGIIDDQDREILGDPFPTATYGLNAQLGFKNFDLNVFFLGNAGVEIFNADRLQGIDPTYPFNLYAETKDRWTGPNTSNTIPRMSTKRDNLNHRASDLFLENGGFFRLKNLTLGYSLPQSVLARLAGLQQVRAFVSGQNVFTVTDYSGMDPELGYIDGTQQGVDYAQFPQARTWTFGLTLGF